jgi:putative addiction module component (TIGR02574 family)
MFLMPAGFPELEKLPVDEKMILAAELWGEATAEDAVGQPDPKIVDALEERMEQYRRDPSSALSWEEVKRRVRQHG